MLSSSKKIELGFTPNDNAVEIPAKSLQRQFKSEAFRERVDKKYFVLLADEKDGLHNRIVGIADKHTNGKLNLIENSGNYRLVDEDSAVIIVWVKAPQIYIE